MREYLLIFFIKYYQLLFLSKNVLKFEKVSSTQLFHDEFQDFLILNNLNLEITLQPVYMRQQYIHHFF